MKNKKIIISITVLLLITLVLAGLTYAYYRTRVIGNYSTTPSISVTSKKLGVSYEDGEAVLSTNGKIKPGFTATKAFSVVNTGQGPANYSIIIDNVNNEFNKGIRSRGEYYDWKYYLYSGTEVNDNNLIVSGNVTFDNLQYLVKKVTIDAGKTLNYILKIEYLYLEDVDQSDDMTSRFSLRVNISNEALPKYSLKALLLSSEDIATIRPEDLGEIGVSTKPGEAAGQYETEISYVDDDYTATTGEPSYYLRGNHVFNYVTYSGMCWRIVRIDGNDNIKLVLADGQHACGVDTGYNPNDNSSAYIQYMNDDEYLDVKTISEYGNSYVFEESNLYRELKNWMSSSNLDTSNLVEAEWCNDVSLIGIEYQDWDGEPVEAGSSLINFTINNYAFYNRVKNPTLKCDSVGINGTKAIKFPSNIGVLTADELVFAGYKMQGTGYSYLTDNTGYSNYGYFTMTPYSDTTSISDEEFVPVLAVANKDYLSNSQPNGWYGIRPAIVVSKTAGVTYDETSSYTKGSYQNPYVIG